MQHSCWLPATREEGERLTCYVCGRKYVVVYEDDGLLGDFVWMLDTDPLY